MKINQATIDLVKKWEGFKPEAYLCPANVWTIGYGTTSRAGIGVNVKPEMKTTQQEAEEWLRMGLEKFGAQIKPAITADINENEFGAFVSLAYNIGHAAFVKSSALRHFNNGDKDKAAEAIKLWNKATVNGKRQVLRGLVNRREDEVKLFMTPPKKARSTAAQSTTIQASATQIAAGAGTALTGVGYLDGNAQIVLMVLGTIIILAGVWIFKERLRKWASGDK